MKCKCEYDLSTQNPNYLQFSSRRYLLLIVAIQNFQATVSSFGKSSGFLKTLFDPTSVGLLILYATQRKVFERIDSGSVALSWRTKVCYQEESTS